MREPRRDHVSDGASGQFRGGATNLFARPSTKRLIAAALLLVALGVRIAAVQHYHYKAVYDARSYLALSGGSHRTRRLLEHGPACGLPATAYFHRRSLTSWRSPPSSTATRTKSKSPSNAPHAVRLEQAALGHDHGRPDRLGRALELFGSTTALIALGIAAVYPVLIEMSTVRLPRTSWRLSNLAAIYAALQVPRARDRRAGWSSAGCSPGLAALSHTNGVLLVIPMAIAMWNVRRVSDSPAWARRPRWSAPLLLLLVTGVTITPWLIRDAVLLHTFVPISDEGGITVAGTYNARAAHERDPPFRWRFPAAVPSLRHIVRHHRSMTESQFSSRLETAALNYIGNHPFYPREGRIRQHLAPARARGEACRSTRRGRSV